MRTTKEIKITTADRRKIRHELINIFLDEEPGTGRGELRSFYSYTADILANGKKIILKRPARLNKGFDFEVHVEDTNFGTTRWRTMPSHSDIYDDLEAKAEEDPKEFEKVREIITLLYECNEVEDDTMRSLKFTEGHPIEAILKAIKWLFIEQDMTYWNWSGRAMLYSNIQEL